MEGALDRDSGGRNIPCLNENWASSVFADSILRVNLDVAMRDAEWNALRGCLTAYLVR